MIETPLIALAVGFLVLLNPFALFIYLQPLMKELSGRDFSRVLLYASGISFAVFAVFAFFGEEIFSDVFRINFESFRIFGGIIIFALAFNFIINGRLAVFSTRENLHDLASEIALPFFVGAGTISQAIIIGNAAPAVKSIPTIAGVLFFTFAALMLLKTIRDVLKGKFKVAFDKFMNVFLRINGFFMGAIGLDMIVTGIERLL